MDERRLQDTLSDVERVALESVEREVRDVLAETPSPEFFARVRQRTAEESISGPVRTISWAMAGFALAAGALVLGVVTLRPQPHAIVDGPPTRSIDTSQPLATVAIQHPGQKDLPPSHPAPLSGGRSRAVRAASATGGADSEVLVPTGQMDAVRRYAEFFRLAPVVGQPLNLTTNEVPSPSRYSDLVLASLQMEPLIGLGDVRTLDVVHRNQ